MSKPGCELDADTHKICSLFSVIFQKIWMRQKTQHVASNLFLHIFMYTRPEIKSVSHAGACCVSALRHSQMGYKVFGYATIWFHQWQCEKRYWHSSLKKIIVFERSSEQFFLFFKIAGCCGSSSTTILIIREPSCSLNMVIRKENLIPSACVCQFLFCEFFLLYAAHISHAHFG